ncbi:PIG-L deacetylase family protein [Streptomyces sp. NPDC056638]|uniref:PIG-L deacetylase family protein n=1 Tax=Streptomyces sp. NPDC056638 TaxID=3345887 RepID=UPI0036935313
MTPSTPPSLMGVFAHPDDESLLADGVLAQHTAAGARTAVVTTTWAADSPRAAHLADALDKLGQMTGHPDHRRTHQIPLLACETAGLPHLYPEAGDPWQPQALYAATHPDSGVGELAPLLTDVGKSVLCIPDEYVTTVVDVTQWVAVKWRAILAHQGEVARERSLPGILARLPAETRHKIIRTEYFTRLTPGPAPGDPHRLTT